MKKTVIAGLAAAFIMPGAALAAGQCDVYHDAIMSCAKRGCDTNMDDFVRCLVEEQGITDRADDGTNEVKELVKCFKTEYVCR